jgi:hypothetical protein
VDCEHERRERAKTNAPITRPKEEETGEVGGLPVSAAGIEPGPFEDVVVDEKRLAASWPGG